MKFIILKPTSPSKRHYLNISNKVSKKPTLKLKKYKYSNGRNNKGKITVKHKKTGHKQLFRKINFDFNSKLNLIGITYSIEYDPNRNAYIASIFNIKLRSFFYIIAPRNLKIGNIIKIGNNANEKIGHVMLIDKVPMGCPIYNISLKPNKKSKLSRSAGTYSLILNKKSKYIQILLSSGEKKFLLNKVSCCIGIVSNEFYFLKQLGKAGRSTWLGKKSIVRGVAMNPIDHPNGGGEGRKSSKKKNPWGK